jgi:hypothetical protein
MSGHDIAAEVASALREAGGATGEGPDYCTLRREPATSATTPSQAEAAAGQPPELIEVVALQSERQRRDRTGSPGGEARRVLMIEATSAQPRKTDWIAPGVREANVDADTQFERIESVKEEKPAGGVLFYEINLQT